MQVQVSDDRESGINTYDPSSGNGIDINAGMKTSNADASDAPIATDLSNVPGAKTAAPGNNDSSKNRFPMPVYVAIGGIAGACLGLLRQSTKEKMIMSVVGGMLIGASLSLFTEKRRPQNIQK